MLGYKHDDKKRAAAQCQSMAQAASAHPPRVLHGEVEPRARQRILQMTSKGLLDGLLIVRLLGGTVTRVFRPCAKTLL